MVCKITTEWTGNIGSGTTNYSSYSRNHKITGAGKYAEILASSDPKFRGDNSRYNPEDLFLSSLSACHMLWYLHLCSVENIVITAYIDNSTGILEENEDGSGKFVEVILEPEVTIHDKDRQQEAIELHSQANKMCFIANSCNFKIGHKPKIIFI